MHSWQDHVVSRTKTVAITAATVVTSAVRNVSIAMGSDAHLENTAKGTMKIMMKLKHAPVKKSPNIHCETIRISFRMSSTCAGSATIPGQQAQLLHIQNTSRTCSSSKQLALQYLHRIEPV
jgi:hypothetical protein